MLGNDFSEDEQCAAVQALWNLTIIDEIRTSKELQTSVEALEKLAKSNNHHLQQICNKTLLQIKHIKDPLSSAKASGHTKTTMKSSQKRSQTKKLVRYWTREGGRLVRKYKGNV
ncbi:uncharacterized protein [Amphiura filiformis]|uniref:uncharacterized protein n=1 Tax=Amphiura filiformis TaxID=82378 RepID=UPI003B219B0A